MNAESNTEPNPAHADIGLISALPTECRAFLRYCDRVNSYSGGEFTFRGGRFGPDWDLKVAVVETKLGFAKARRATQAMLDAHTPDWIISSGFSGALQPHLKVGDIVIADSLVDTHGNEVKVAFNMPARPGVHVGRFVNSDALVRSVQEKRELAERFDAIAVDLESLAVAQVCRESKTRFMSVRVISDDLSADLPPEIHSVIGSSGPKRFGATLGALWKRSGSVKQLWELHEQSGRAADRLAGFLGGVIIQLCDRR